MSKKRFWINLILISVACVITVGTMIATLLANISQTDGFLICGAGLIICCSGLVWTNYRFNAYGTQFASRYPDADQKKSK